MGKNFSGITVRCLGTNGWYDSKTGNTICLLIETPNEYILLDAGNGLYKADQFIKTAKPVYLFLSHFHLDHVEGLHTLAKFRFKGGLTIVVPPRGKKLFQTLVRQPFTLPIAELKMPTKLTDQADQPFVAERLLLRHVTPCWGLRLNLGGNIVSYIPDTGECENAYRLAQDADLVLSECAFAPGMVNPEWEHLNPGVAAKIAKHSGAKKLVLVHFDAEVYNSLAKRQKAQVAARKTFKNSFVAFDDQKIEL